MPKPSQALEQAHRRRAMAELELARSIEEYAHVIESEALHPSAMGEASSARAKAREHRRSATWSREAACRLNLAARAAHSG